MELSLNLEIRSSKAIIYSKNLQNNPSVYSLPIKNDTDLFDISNVWGAVDSIFDLGDSNFFSWLRLNEKEQNKFWEIVSKLIKAGIIGYRYYEVNGHLERHFIEYEITNPKFSNAKVKYIDKKQYSRDWLV